MADVTGPTNLLPGDVTRLPKGQMCDNHPDRPAVVRVAGEVDSFGAELHDLCQECLDEMRDAGPTKGTCDWCKTPDLILQPRRDYEEGLCGRVYDVCEACIRKENARLAEEIDDDYY